MYSTDEAKQRLANLGINISTKGFRAREQQVRAEAKEHARKSFDGDKGNIAAKTLITRLLNWATIAGMLLVTGIFTLILFALFVVESLAVIHALQNLLPTYEAVLMGLTLVGSLYVTLFVNQLLVANRIESYEWSLRVWWQNCRYLLGLGNWKARYKQHDKHKASQDVLRTLVIAVILLSTLGRLGSILNEIGDMPASEGIQILIFETSLTEWFSVFFVGYATYAIIAASHFSFSFLFSNFVRITGGGIDLNHNPKSIEQLEAEFVQDYYNTLVINTEAQYQLKTEN